VFTGIVREVGTVASLEGSDEGIRLEVGAPATASEVAVGDSVAIGGVCLTVVATDGRVLAFDAVPETLSRTALRTLESGSRVNLEPALRAGDPLGGHVVQGHVDGTAEVVSREPGDRWEVVTFTLPSHLARYVVLKGSITVDGVSLTVSDVGDTTFAVSLIPTTLELTTLGRRRPGERVNLEVDVIAKYVERLLTAGGTTDVRGAAEDFPPAETARSERRR
jgi:riboflavin synthase